MMNIVFIGHVNSGKSTIAGHLVYDCGSFDESKMQKIIDEANQLNKSSYKYAFIFDKLSEERAKGNTLNISMRKLETSKRIYSIIDSPGHRDYIINMINGTSQADTAILVVNAEKDGFEEGISMNGQTREHAIIVHTFNIKNIIVAVNKMDDITVK